MQAADPEFRGGANRESLKEAQREFRRLHPTESFPNLCYLMSSYFHQDWECEADSDLGVIRQFSSTEASTVTKALAEELAMLARESWSDADFKDLLRECGGYLVPDCSWSSWVARIREELITSQSH